MEKVILKAEVRTGTGKKAAKDLRAKAIIPANVYKGSKGALNIQIANDEFEDIIHTKAGENFIITLKISQGGRIKDRTVVIKEIQREPIKDRILHVDFNEISLTEALKVGVPLVSHGESVGVKADGGILEHVLRELHVECLPTAIPEKIEVDISNLKIGDAIYVKDIAATAGVKILNDPELIAMIVKAPKVEVPKEEVVAAAEEPELIRKKKEEVLEEGPEEAPKAGEGQAKETKKE